MQVSIQKFLGFYRPFMTTTMDTRFKWGELIFQFVLPFIMAVGATVPLFHRHWTLGIGSVILVALILYSIHCAVMRMSAYQREDGELYISPSLMGLSFTFSSLLLIFLSVGYFFLLAHLTGWPVMK